MTDRDIYTYADGGRRGDPLAIQRRLFIHTDGRVNDLIATRAGGDELAAAVAEEELLDAARRALGFDPFEAGGPTDAEVIAELDRFTTWLTDQKKTAVTSPSSPPPTESPPASTTPRSSASG